MHEKAHLHYRDVLDQEQVLRVAHVTSHFFTQIAEHCGGFLGPSSAVDFCGQNCSFLRVYLKLGESLCLRCPKVQNFKIIWPAHEAGL